jgi:hypothetical protein
MTNKQVSRTAIELAKRFDDVFAIMYDKLNMIPEPLDYFDKDGIRRTYIYKA